MELTFTWESDTTAHRAGAEILPSGDKALEILANLLVDDGGTSTEHSIRWIDTGIERMQSVIARLPGSVQTRCCRDSKTA